MGYNYCMVKKVIFLFILAAVLLFPDVASAQRRVVPSLEPEIPATEGAIATASGEATPSGIVEKVVERKSDITEEGGETKSRLERLLEEHPAGPLTWTNFLRWTIEQAVRQGVPVNTIVLVLLFPLVAAVVAASRHLIGMRGFGIFTPAVLSVAFLASGIGVGIVLFIVILLVAMLARAVLRRMKLQYLPRMAVLLWSVSLGVFVVMYLATFVNFSGLITVGIFPILILILFAETFIDVQVGRSFQDAMGLTLGTMLLAIITSFLIGLEAVQRTVLLYPEAVVIGVGVFDIFMGKYVGLRLLELTRFQTLMRDQEE